MGGMAMAKQTKFKIMIIDDDEKLIKMLKAHLENYDTVGFTDAYEGIEKLKKEKCDLLILDYLLVDINGEEVVREIRKFNQELYIMLLTGCDKNTIKPFQTLKDVDIQFYCEKSADIDNTLLTIESAIKSIGFLKVKEDNFATRLKKLRKLRGVGQEELSRYLGVSRSAVSNWESNLAEPSNENLKGLSAFFKVGIDYLLGNDFLKK
jgi:DNA-binding NtrC family response regulator